MERGEAGVTMTNKPVTFFLPSLCLFVVLLPPLAQSKAAVLSLRCCCDWGLVFALSRKEFQGRFTSISHGSSLHLLSPSFSFSPLFFKICNHSMVSCLCGIEHTLH